MSYEQFIDESIYTVAVVYSRYITDETVEDQLVEFELETERCESKHFGASEAAFKSYDVPNLYCIKLDQPHLDKLVLKGQEGSYLETYFSIGIKACNNVTSNNTCAPPEVIEENLNFAGFLMFYVDLQVDEKNYTEPGVRFNTFYRAYLGTKSTVLTKMEIGLVEVMTDSGWFLQSNERREYVKLNNIREYLTTQLFEGYIYHMIIEDSRMTTRYTRSYIKLQEALGAAQGLISAFMIIFIIVAYPFSRMKFYESLVNEIFSIKATPSSMDPRTDKAEHGTISKKPNAVTLKEKVRRRKGKANTREEASGTSENEERRISLKSDEQDACKDIRDRNKKAVTTKEIEAALHAQVEINIKSEEDSIKADYIPDEGLHRKNHYTRPPHAYSPLTSPDRSFLIAGKNCLSPDASRRKMSFHSQFPIETEKSMKIEMKMLQEPYEEGFNFMKSAGDDLEINLGDKQEASRNNDEQRGKEVPKSLNEEAQMNEKEDMIGCDQKPIIDDGLNNLGEKECLEDPKAIQNFLASRSNNNQIDCIKESLTNIDAAKTVQLNLTFSEYLSSFIRKDGYAKRKVDSINFGISLINERLDVFNILKKLREVDKLKVLILEEHHRSLFNGLPKPEINLEDQNTDSLDARMTQYQVLKGPRFIERVASTREVLRSIDKIRSKTDKSQIDQKFVEIYSEFFGLNRHKHYTNN